MSTNYFARHIGLSRGENLYQIKRGNNGISRDLASRIVTRFPQIDKLWLLTGEGQMFGSPELSSAQIPYYNIDAECGVQLRDRLVPELNLVIPQLEGCDFAMRYDGQAMSPLIPAGSVVLLKAVACDAIIPGAEYVIISRKIITLRVVRAGKSETQLRLVAGNKENFDDIMLDICDLEGAYKVVGKLIINK